jgi:hypothetical protein
MVTRWGSAGRGNGSGTAVSPSHDPAFSHSAATALASSQLVLPVYLRLNVPDSVPVANINTRNASSRACVLQIRRSLTRRETALRIPLVAAIKV